MPVLCKIKNGLSHSLGRSSNTCSDALVFATPVFPDLPTLILSAGLSAIAPSP